MGVGGAVQGESVTVGQARDMTHRSFFVEAFRKSFHRYISGHKHGGMILYRKS